MGKRKEHPADVFMATLDGCLNDCLKRLSPWLGPNKTGGVIEGCVTGQKLSERLQRHINTHLSTELHEIVTGEGDAGVGLVHAMEAYPQDQVANMKARLHLAYKQRRRA